MSVLMNRLAEIFARRLVPFIGLGVRLRSVKMFRILMKKNNRVVELRDR